MKPVTTLPNFQQPRGIYYLFLTEMWERFSYYGITALLILYIAKTFHVSDKMVYAIYGAYGALVYTTPIIGGYLSDRFLGTFRAIILGALLISAGHFILAIPDPAHFYFFLGLSFIITGTGLFKPNIATVVGLLYSNNDPRREGGFTFAYMGSNLGTIIAPIICSYIAVEYSWLLAFSLAGVGMLIGLGFFIAGMKYYHPSIYAPSHQPYLSRKSWIPKSLNHVLSYLVIALTIVLINIAMNHVAIAGFLLYFAGGAILSMLLLASFRAEKSERNPMLLVIILTLFYIIFMALLQQSGGMLNLFTDSHVDRVFFGYAIPTGMYQSVEPLFIVALAPLFAILWRKLSQKNYVLSYPMKFALSLIGMGFAFGLLIIAMQFLDANNLMASSWINTSYFIQALSELFVGPIGLGMISVLVPQRFMGIFMGAWVLASAYANFLAAKIGALTAPIATKIQEVSVQASLSLYNHAFIDLTIFAFSAALVLLALKPLLNRMLVAAR